MWSLKHDGGIKRDVGVCCVSRLLQLLGLSACGRVVCPTSRNSAQFRLMRKGDNLMVAVKREHRRRGFGTTYCTEYSTGDQDRHSIRYCCKICTMQKCWFDENYVNEIDTFARKVHACIICKNLDFCVNWILKCHLITPTLMCIARHVCITLRLQKHRGLRRQEDHLHPSQDKTLDDWHTKHVQLSLQIGQRVI